MELNGLFDNRTAIAEKVVTDMQDITDTWGVTITRFEVINLYPSDRMVQNSLHKQAVAQREKIWMTLTAEANREKTMIYADANLYKTKKAADA